MKKYYILLSIIIGSLGLALKANASKFGEGLSNVAQKSGLQTTVTPEQYAAGIVSTFLTLIGIIFVVLLIYGGYLYLTSQGESEKVGKGKKVITASIVGLAIIITGYSITYFITSQLEQPGVVPGYDPNCQAGSLNANSLSCCEQKFLQKNPDPTCCRTYSDYCGHHSECSPCCGDGSCNGGETKASCPYDGCTQ
jgi:hypothetical protein